MGVPLINDDASGLHQWKKQWENLIQLIDQQLRQVHIDKVFLHHASNLAFLYRENDQHKGKVAIDVTHFKSPV